MKKFLFTLFALLVTCTAYAAGAKGYMYMPDTVLTADQLGKNVKMPVYVVLDNEYMNGFQCKFAYPDKIQGRTVSGNSSVLVIKDAILDSQGHTAEDLYDPEDEDDPDNPVGPNYAQITFSGNATNCLGIGPAAQGYWDPQGDGTYETYGSVKLGPNGKLLLFYVTIRPAADFTDGYITMRWMWSGGADARNGQGSISTGDPTVDDGFTTLMVHVTVKQDNPAPAAEITNEGNVVTANVDGETFGTHTVELYYINGNDTIKCDINPYAYPQTYEDQKITFIAKTLANDGETEDTWSEPKEITIPAKNKETVDAPTVVGQANENAWQYNIVITPDGDGELNYTTSDEPKQVIVDEETGVVTLVFDKGNEAVSVHVEAYTAEGATCAESETTKEDIEIPALDKVATPKINFVVNDDNTITITATCETEGATVVLVGPDNTPYPSGTATVEYDPYEGYSKTWTATATKEHMQDATPGEQLVTVEAINKKDAKKPTVVGQKREGSKTLFDIIITPDPATDGTLEYTAERVAGAKADPQTLTYTREAEDYNVHVTAYTTEGPTYKESAKVDTVITVPKLDQVAEPEINYTVNGDQLTVTATCETEGATVVLVGPDGTEYPNGTATVTFDPYEDYSKTWTATASAEDMLDNSAEKKIEIAKKKVYNVADPTISVDKSDPTKTVITIEATEGDLTYNLTEDGEPFTDYTVEVVDGKTVITIENGEEVKTVKVTATTTLDEIPDGFDEVQPGKAEETVQTPIYQQPQTAAPTIDVSFDGEAPNIYANVTFKNDQADPNAVIEYSLDGENWFVYDPAQPVVIRTDGTTRVYARATADGKATSEEVYRDVNLNQTATSVNELVNGKAVAGVRYFNMAGQEMQEANGITIVVTTYTDGTTSAVKVIK